MIGRDIDKILMTEFANKYFVTKNATEAAKLCGINPKYASKQGAILKHKPQVKKELQKLLNAVKVETLKSVEDLEKKLWAIIEESNRDRIPACNTLMKLKGWESPQKTESEINLNINEVIDELKVLLGATKV